MIKAVKDAVNQAKYSNNVEYLKMLIHNKSLIKIKKIAIEKIKDQDFLYDVITNSKVHISVKNKAAYGIHDTELKIKILKHTKNYQYFNLFFDSIRNHDLVLDYLDKDYLGDFSSKFPSTGYDHLSECISKIDNRDTLKVIKNRLESLDEPNLKLSKLIEERLDETICLDFIMN